MTSEPQHCRGCGFANPVQPCPGLQCAGCKDLLAYVQGCADMLPTVPNEGNLLPTKIKRLLASCAAKDAEIARLTADLRAAVEAANSVVVSATVHVEDAVGSALVPLSMWGRLLGVITRPGARAVGEGT